MADTTHVDPLGRVITLHDRTWYGHILKGHPELDGARILVEHALQSPVEIRHSVSDPDVRLYFGAGPRRGLLVLVAVDVVRRLVKTAHYARKVSGGIVEWSSPMPSRES